MKKWILILATLLVCVVSASAQKKYSGDMFTVAIPNNEWQALEIDLDGGQAITMFKGGEAVEVGVVVTVIGQKVDLQEYLKAQQEAENPIFEGGKFSNIDDDLIMGFQAKVMEFESQLGGQPYMGGLATFHTNKGTCFLLLYNMKEHKNYEDYHEILDNLKFH